MLRSWRPSSCAGVVKGAIDERATRLVCGREVGNDHADVRLLAGGGQQVREGSGRDVGHGARADLLRGEVVEVGRHFIQQDEDGVSCRRRA